MTLLKNITPELIQQIIEKEEIPLRSRTFELETVETVLRYGAVVGSVIEYHPTIPRGMDRARQLIADAEKESRSFLSGTVIQADEMGQSKGRFKRYWHAPTGGLWLTLVMVNTLLPENNLLVPMAAGVACCELLRDIGIDSHIKWVNDVLADNRKISGILTETFIGPQSGEEYILVGIGINVNNEVFPAEFADNSTSIRSLLHKEVSLQETGARLLAKLRWNIGLLYFEEARHLEEHGGIARRQGLQPENSPAKDNLLLQSYKNLTDIFNRRVLFGFDIQESPQFEAKIIGLDNSGSLILELDDSTRIVRNSGEIIYLD